MNLKTPNDDFSQRHRSQIFKPVENGRAINTNFLFFCQIVLLVIPIAFLYAGLYFMNVSSPVIVVVCGIIIFGFLVVVICIQPFTTPEVEGEDTVPLTHDMSPSSKLPYSDRIVTGGAEEKHQVSSSPYRPPKNCPVPSGMIQEQHTVNRATEETTPQGDGGELSDSSNSMIHSGRDSYGQTSTSHSSDEAKDHTSCGPKKSRTDTIRCLENTGSPLTSNEQVEKRGLSEKSSNLHTNHPNEDHIDLLGFPMGEPKECVLSSNDGSRHTKRSKEESVSTPPHRRIKPLSAECRPKKHKPDFRNNRGPSPKAKRVLFRDSGDEPLTKGTESPCDSVATKLKPATPTRSLQKDQPASSYCTHWDQDKPPESPLTLRLYPLSSRQGVFEWAEPILPSHRKNLPDGGFSSVICNMQKIDIAVTSNDTVDESSQTMLPFDTETLHQMMVSSWKESVKHFEDFGTQVEIPKLMPKPSTVVYVIDEKNPSIPSLKKTKSEHVQCHMSESNQSNSRDSGGTANMTNSRYQTKDQYIQQSLKSDAVCNDSILDFVLRRPFSGKSKSPIKNSGHSKISGSLFSEGKVEFNARGSEKHKDKCSSYTKVIHDSTISTLLSTTPGMGSSHSSRELFQCDSPNLEFKDETWNVKTKIISPDKGRKRGDQDDERSEEFYMSLYMGGKDKKYQPSRVGLLATESSKEEVVGGKRKAVSPRIKRKVKIKQGHHLNSSKQGGNAPSQCSPRFDQESYRTELRKMRVNDDASRILPDSSTNQPSPRWFDQSSTRHHRSPCRTSPSCKKQLSPPTSRIPPDSSLLTNQPSPGWFDQSSTWHHRSPCRTSPSCKKQETPPRKKESPRQVSSRTNYDKDKQPRGHTDSKHRHSSFPPFNLDFSSSVQDDDMKQISPKARKNGQKGEAHVRKRRSVTPDKTKRQGSSLMDHGKCKTPDVSPTRNKHRRISHKVESTLFKKSSSSYNNVTIEKVVKQKKKTLKKFK